MTKQWKFFLAIELLLIIWLLYQLTSNFFVALLAISGILVLISSSKSKESKRNRNYMVGIFLLLFAVMSTSAFWLLLLFTVGFVSIKGSAGLTSLNKRFFTNAPWNEKDMIMVETAETTPKSGRRQKRDFIGHQKIGSHIFEWDDINFSIFMGDTIIDLGNTFLPKTESYIVIRKGFGKTRILVPQGIGVMVEHSALKGNVLFEGQGYALLNESVKLYSRNFDKDNRKLKIITSSLVGDIEVITV